MLKIHTNKKNNQKIVFLPKKEMIFLKENDAKFLDINKNNFIKKRGNEKYAT